MPEIRPFAAVRYAHRPELELSRLIAPPYDVLDDAAKATLQARHPNNIVTIDLPFTPPKALGPDAVYERAAVTMRSWLDAGVLQRDARPSLYPYTQSYQHHGRNFHRRGFFALVRLSPFGAGQVVPHERTYAGPIEDRLRLMQATGAQLSPVFGLFSDPRGEVTRRLYHGLGRPAASAEMDGVLNQLWSVHDSQLEREVIDLLAGRPVYIADGHHRYTTALHHQKWMQEKSGGALPPNHPANFCLFVLVSMQDDGLIILPTHRLVGGLKPFDVAAFRAAVADAFDVVDAAFTPDRLDAFAAHLAAGPAHAIGLYDAASRRAYTLQLRDADVLKRLEPGQSEAWRRLDVAILQRYLLDEVLQKRFADGELRRGYSADASGIAAQASAQDYQLALLLRPTPLHALEELGRHSEVMPQKSTYFAPKLATGMVIAPLA